MSDSHRQPVTDDETSPSLNPETTYSPLHILMAQYIGYIHEPLTSFTRALLFACILLIGLMTLFIGLFAGAEYRIRHPHVPSITATVTETLRETTTTVVTSTFEIPLPSPAPRAVCGMRTGYLRADHRKQDTCTTADCLILSASIASGLEITQDPCENFYHFVSMLIYFSHSPQSTHLA